MAETRTINLEIKDNFKKVEKDIDDLNESLKDTAENNRDVSKTFEEVYGELKPLTARMGEAEDRLYELAAAGQTTTQEYRDLLQTVGEYRQVQIKTDLAVDGAAQTMTQKLGSALNGATSAFSTTQGAIALFGSENEALEESLLKVQAALAIQQGVDGLTTSYKELGGKTGIATKAQAVFNFVMNLNPILLIVSGITLAIAALLKFTSVLDPVIDGLKNFGDAIGLTDFAAEEKEKNDKKRDAETIARANKRLTEIDKEIAAREKLRKNIDYAYSVQDKAAQRQIELLKTQGKDTTNLEKARLKAALSYQTQLQTETYLLIQQNKEKSLLTANELYAIGVRTKDFAEYNKFMREFKAKQGELLKTNLEATESKKDLVNQLAILDIEEKKGSVDRNKNFADKQRELARQIEKERIDAMEDGMEKRLALLKFNEEGELSQIKGKGKKEGELRTAIETRYEKERDKIKEEFRVRRDRDEDVSLEKRPIKRLEIGKSEIDAEAYVQSELLRLQQEADDKRKANTIKRTDEILKATQTFTQVYSSLNGLLNASDNERLKKVEKGSKEEQRIKKRMFNRDKALRISQTIVDTASNIVTSVRNGGGIPTGIPFGIAAGAMGALQIAAITKAKYDGGETPSPDAGGDVPSGGGASTTPQFNTIGSSGVNQLAQLQQQPVQAYVVSGDVTSAQSLDRNRIQNATL
jgi:hypothetical protein